jgi:hypothetical protein
LVFIVNPISMNSVQELEAAIVTELRVMGVVFGNRPGKQLEWARATIEPAYVEAYMQGWRMGRKGAWQRLLSLSNRLRDVAGESEEEWFARLHRLEILTGVDILSLRPTTLRMGF